MVRVNDRGPFVRGRVLDCSEAAARQLGFRGRGVAQVALDWPEDATPPVRLRGAQDRAVGARAGAVARPAEIF